MAIAGAGGEEWQNFEKTQGYKPEQWQDDIEGARASIDSARKRQARVRLIGRQGQPLAGRRVKVEQLRTAFIWGHCGWGHQSHMLAGDFQVSEYQHVYKLQSKIFNAINLMHYWAEVHCTNAPVSEEYQGEVSYDLLQQSVDWARSFGYMAKGHPMYWPCPKAIPDWLRKYDYETRLKFLEVRVRQIAARFRGKISAYDAVNEMMWEPTLKHTDERHWPHIESIEELADEAGNVMRWAREEDPDATYTLNEYGIALNDENEVPVPTKDGRIITRGEQYERYISLLQELQQRDAGPDAAGIQTCPGGWGHHDRQISTYNDIGERTGLPVHITESRIGTKHLEKVGMPDDEIDKRLAECVANTITCAFGNPHVEAFYFWGDHRMFRGRKTTAVYNKVHELIREQWMTNLELHSDADGYIDFHGFHGDYSLQVERANGSFSAAGFTLDNTGNDQQDGVVRLRGL